MDQHLGSELPPIQDTELQQPQPVQSAETMAGDITNEQAAAQAVELGLGVAGQAPGADNPLTPIAPAPKQGVPLAPAPQSSGFPGMPTMADDTDLIEKEWVLKAKEIVARTRHDPYQQNKQVESFKADYMKKRYNKDIKLTED